MKNACLSTLLPAFVMAVAPLLNTPAFSAESDSLNTKELISLMQKGGYVIYLRHGATDHAQNDKDLSDLRECSNQRNLSKLGKQQSRSLGESFKLLDIKLDQIYSSPYCRCVDTALYAFNRVQIDEDMRASFATDKADTEFLKKHLTQQLKQQPSPGFNRLLVGHTANLREVTDVWPKPEGVMHIFKPLGEEGYKHMGKIVPSEWKDIHEKLKE